MLFDRFDRIRIVSLAERRDRRAEMLGELKRIGVAEDPRVAFFDAYKVPDAGPFRSPGSHGCFLSHLEILEEAGRHSKSVLILQDDCQFLPSIRDYEMPECDLFYGGYDAVSNPADPHESDIVGAHFMGFSAEAARKAGAYLRALLDPAFPPDERAAAEPTFNPAIRPPIDGALVWFRRAHPELKTVFALLSKQRSSRSDITPRSVFDRVPLVRRLADSGRKIRRRLGGQS